LPTKGFIIQPQTTGVRIIEYRVPQTDGKFTKRINNVDVNKGYTTGRLKGDGSKNFIKNIYDPSIWTDLLNSLRE